MAFFVVQHGDQKKTLFNANCKVAILLDNIKLRCGCDKTTMIDLFDSTGSMCRLEDHPKDNGIKFVRERETYILVKREEHNGITKYTCLLKGLESSDPELLDQIEGRSQEQRPSNSRLAERRISTKLPDKKHIAHALIAKRKSRPFNKI